MEQQDLEKSVEETIQKIGNQLFDGYNPRIEKLRPLLISVITDAARQGASEAAEAITQDQLPVTLKLSVRDASSLFGVLASVRVLRFCITDYIIENLPGTLGNALKALVEADKLWQTSKLGSD